MKRLSLSVVKRKLIEEKAGGIIPQAEDIAAELKKDRGIKVKSERIDPKPPTPKQGNFGNTKAKITKYTPVKTGNGEKSTGGFSPEKTSGTPVQGQGKAQKGKDYGNRPNFSKASSPSMKASSGGGNTKSPMPDAHDLSGDRGFMGAKHIKPEPVFYKSGSEDPDTRNQNNKKKPTWDGKGIETFKPGKGEPKISGIEGGNSVLKTGGIWKNIDQSPRQEKVAEPNMRVGGSVKPGGSKDKSPSVTGDGGSSGGGSGKDKSPMSATGDHGRERSTPKRFNETKLLREFFEEQIASEFAQKVQDGVLDEGELKSFALDKAREMSRDPSEQRQIYENIVSNYHSMTGTRPEPDVTESILVEDPEDQPQRGEPVMEGVIEVRVAGRRKVCLEAAVPSVLSRVIDGYEQAGLRVQVRQVSLTKPSHDNPRFARLMLEAIHAKKYGMRDIETKRFRSAFVAFKGLIESEYSPFYYESKSDWNERAVLPAFEQAVACFEAAYQGSLKPFDVIVRAKTRRGLEDFDVMTEAFDRDMAAGNAVNEVRATVGLSAKVIHAFVDGKKYVAEEFDTSPFSKLPKFFDDLPQPPGKIMQGGREGGDVAKKPKVDKMKMGGDKKAKYDGYGGMKTVDSMKVSGKSGKVADPNMDDPKPPKDKTISTKDLDVKDDGPIYCEATRPRSGYSSSESGSITMGGSPNSGAQAMSPQIAKLVTSMRDDAARVNDHSMANLLSRVSDRLEYRENLTGDESKALERYLVWKKRQMRGPKSESVEEGLGDMVAGVKRHVGRFRNATSMSPAEAKLVRELNSDLSRCTDAGTKQMLTRLVDLYQNHRDEMSNDDKRALTHYLEMKHRKAHGPAERQSPSMAAESRRHAGRAREILGKDGRVMARIERNRSGSITGITA